jgi:hypothetical protein
MLPFIKKKYMRLKFLYTLIFVCGLSAWASSNETAGRCRKIEPAVSPARQPAADKADKYGISEKEKEGDEEGIPEYAPFLRALYV